MHHDSIDVGSLNLLCGSKWCHDRAPQMKPTNALSKRFGNSRVDNRNKSATLLSCEESTKVYLLEPW